MRKAVPGTSTFGLTAWRERVGATFMRFEMEAPLRGRFSGRLAEVALGPLRLYDFTAPAHAVRRAPDAGRPDAGRTILAVTQIDGECVYTDAAAALTLRPGDVLFLHPDRRFGMHFPRDMRLRVVAIPAPLLANGSLAYGHVCGTVARAGAGATVIARALLDGIYTQAARLSMAEQGRMARHLVDMFDTLAGLALADAGSGHSGTRAAQLARVLAYVRDHLANPALNAQTIARGLRISPRYVRELLHAHGTQLRLLLLQQRLEHCREDLLDPLRRHRSASAIAYAWGFNSAAHFTRAFHARYGLPPACYRRRYANTAIPSASRET